MAIALDKVLPYRKDIRERLLGPVEIDNQKGHRRAPRKQTTRPVMASDQPVRARVQRLVSAVVRNMAAVAKTKDAKIG